jgi:hypothetical protein
MVFPLFRATEQRGRDVFERAAAAQLHSDRLFIDQMKRHGIRRVRSVRIARQSDRSSVPRCRDRQ